MVARLCQMATRLPKVARDTGWALPSSPEGFSSQRGKGPLSLERAAFLQEEGNLALNLCPEARPGRGRRREGRELSFLSRHCDPRGPGLLAPSPSWGEATSLLDLSSKADRAFSLLSPQPAAPTPCLSPSATLLPSCSPSLCCPETSRVCPAPSPGAAAWPAEQSGLSYCTPGAPSLQQLPGPVPAQGAQQGLPSQTTFPQQSAQVSQCSPWGPTKRGVLSAWL